MYRALKHDITVNLWCDGRTEGDRLGSKDNSNDVYIPNTKRARREDEIDKVFNILHEKHAENFNDFQLRLWARMYVNGTCKSLDTPPNVPAISGEHPTAKQRKGDKNQHFTEALTSAATAITKALVNDRPSTPTAPPKLSGGISPASKANLSGQYLQQLRTLQQLRENNALTEKEFQEQKELLLSNIRGINSVS